jgi:hypothetical protein
MPQSRCLMSRTSRAIAVAIWSDEPALDPLVLVIAADHEHRRKVDMRCTTSARLSPDGYRK